MNLLESQHWTVRGESRFRHSGISPSLQERVRLLILPRVGKGLAGTMGKDCCFCSTEQCPSPWFIGAGPPEF